VTLDLERVVVTLDRLGPVERLLGRVAELERTSSNG
jgi:hypothetical protein